MRLKTIILILATACLVALSLAACGGENHPEEKTSSDTQVNPTVGESADVTETDVTNPTTSYSESAGSDAAETDPSETVKTEDSSHGSAETEAATQQEVIGPQPPAPETEPEETMPDFSGMETNDNGEIELPFIPFPED